MARITPLDRCRRYDCYLLGTVDTTRLNRTIIKELFEKSNCRSIPDILEDDDGFYFQYENKPIILISKKDGKFYAKQREKEKASIQAHPIWDILKRSGYIIRPDYNYYYHTRTISFLKEETEGKEKKVGCPTERTGLCSFFSNFIPSVSKEKVNER
jgi:hypothetical protein